LSNFLSISKGYVEDMNISFCVIDIDECSGSHGCDPINSICGNIAGSFNCDCRDGFEDDGTGIRVCKGNLQIYIFRAVSVGNNIALKILPCVRYPHSCNSIISDVIRSSGKQLADRHAGIYWKIR
jgi:hypothetical protein